MKPTIEDRLTRLESRLVIGFEQLGVDVKTRRLNIEVDHARRVISVPTGGTSLQVLIEKIPAESDVAYRVDIDGYPVCMLARYEDAY